MIEELAQSNRLVETVCEGFSLPKTTGKRKTLFQFTGCSPSLRGKTGRSSSKNLETGIEAEVMEEFVSLRNSENIEANHDIAQTTE